MRTLIRASQLHPDVSGLVSGYTAPLYPNYNDILAGSGISTYISGRSLVVGLQNNTSVSDINGLSGSIQLRGFNGVNISKTGNNIDFNLTGLGTVGTLNGLSGNLNIQGSGMADVWPLNYNTIVVKVDPISGLDPVSVFTSGNQTIISIASGNAMTSLNGVAGDAIIYGEHGISVSTSGEGIYISAYEAAHSGVHGINDIRGKNIILSGDESIRVLNDESNGEILINYIGSGWGDNYLLLNISGKKNINWIGDLNFFDGDNRVFSQGYFNGFIQNELCATLNGYKSYLYKCSNTATINANESIVSGISGTTLINPHLTQGTYLNNHSFMVGTPNINTFYNTSLYTAKISGFEVSNFNPLKLMKIPKTTQDFINISTGSVLMGHIDYVAAAYHITDFFASSNIRNNGMYGRKYFTVQRTNQLQVNVRDEADLFGGFDKYNILLSGGTNDGRLYLIASGFSGHNTFFMANVQYTQFSLNLIDE